MSGSGKIHLLPFILVLFCAKDSLQAVYSHSQALQMVNGAGISVTSSGQCSNRANTQCTSLDGIHSEAIDGIITLKKASGCSMVITGATEAGHGSAGRRSHGNGWKIDIRKRGEDCITNYIKRNFQKISKIRWRAPSGNIYLDEHNHWDIQYGNNIRDKRAVIDENQSAINSSAVVEGLDEVEQQQHEFDGFNTSSNMERHKRPIDSNSNMAILSRVKRCVGLYGSCFFNNACCSGYCEWKSGSGNFCNHPTYGNCRPANP